MSKMQNWRADGPGGKACPCCGTRPNQREIDKREAQQEISEELTPVEYPVVLDYDDAHWDCRFQPDTHYYVSGVCFFCDDVETPK